MSCLRYVDIHNCYVQLLTILDLAEHYVTWLACKFFFHEEFYLLRTDLDNTSRSPSRIAGWVWLEMLVVGQA